MLKQAGDPAPEGKLAQSSQPSTAVEDPDPSARPLTSPSPSPRAFQAKPRKNHSARQFWLKQLHTWHWASAAISLVGMFLFAITGITLNHASTILTEPKVVSREATLPRSMLGLLQRHTGQHKPLPERVATEVAALVGIETYGKQAEWSPEEAYIAIPGPGSDAWVSIDLATGAITSETTDRGWVSFFNDLHKGRNSGTAWFWFIDIFAIACILFTFTGLLLLQLHARHRPATWPLVGIGTAIPLIIILYFLHI